MTSKAVAIATGLRADGHREVLGVDLGDSENETFWTEFLRDLKDRGLKGVHLVISDAHSGLRAAIRQVFQGASWQRCRVHAMRNLMSSARHDHRQVIAALIRTIFVQNRITRLHQTTERNHLDPAAGHRIRRYGVASSRQQSVKGRGAPGPGHGKPLAPTRAPKQAWSPELRE